MIYGRRYKEKGNGELQEERRKGHSRTAVEGFFHFFFYSFIPILFTTITTTKKKKRKKKRNDFQAWIASALEASSGAVKETLITYSYSYYYTTLSPFLHDLQTFSLSPTDCSDASSSFPWE